MPENFEPLASAEEAAVYLRIHVKTLRRLAREGRVPCAKIGKYYRFRLSELDHWVRQDNFKRTIRDLRGTVGNLKRWQGTIGNSYCGDNVGLNRASQPKECYTFLAL